MRCSTGTTHLRLGPSLRPRGVLTEPVCLPHPGPSVLFCSVPRQSNTVSWLCSMSILLNVNNMCSTYMLFFNNFQVSSLQSANGI